MNLQTEHYLETVKEAKNELKKPELTTEEVRKYFCEKATDKEVFMFLNICKMANLNPFLREVYLVKYDESKPAQILTGYEVYLKRAETSNQWGGFKVWTEGEGENMIAKIKIYRKDWKEPMEHEVDFKEYAQYKTDYATKKRVLTRFWSEKPKTMLKKVVISQAFRLAFPKELGGLPYVQEEINSMPEELQNTAEILKLKSEPMEEKNGITSKEYQDLMDLALKNGYSVQDILDECKSLGYEKFSTEILTWDYETIVERFSKVKENAK